jgi:hypothetical protein
LEEYRERDRERRERSEEWRSRERERSGERQAEMRARMEQMFDDQIARTTDPAAQQRIAAIEEYMNYNRELATQMRRAETDEEREAIRAALEANMQTTQDLMRAQQDYMLGEALAGWHGLRWLGRTRSRRTRLGRR